MCGIFGAAFNRESKIDFVTLQATLRGLFKLSESRGKEAGGLAVKLPSDIITQRYPCNASKFLSSKEYQAFVKRVGDVYFEQNALKTNFGLFIGHCRLATNGSFLDEENNQPVRSENLVGVHNGIVANDMELWQQNPELTRESKVDTEVLLKLIDNHRRSGLSIAEATQKTYGQLQGTASIGVIFDKKDRLLVATNNGSLYYSQSPGLLLFASERHILQKFHKLRKFVSRLGHISIHQLDAGKAHLIDCRTLEKEIFDLPKPTRARPSEIFIPSTVNKRQGIALKQSTDIASLKRCTKCILPETVPYITFDKDGVCNYCRSYTPVKMKAMAELQRQLEPYRQKKGANCLAAFSGGRDSSYGLHFLVKELGMRPVAYTYDWGMVNDIARRNQARLCGALGVEHIIVSADIPKKLRYIKMNIEAWLKRPDLGLVPLFMAGDKQFFYYANQVGRQLDCDLVFFSQNPLERTQFKAGFCNVPPEHDEYKPQHITWLNKARMAWYYLKQFSLNPSYLNPSVFDTLFGFASYYMVPHNYLYTFNYIPWDEDTVVDVLANEYDWESAKDASTTWRIGDGTAPFYNYIYLTTCGFTENDSLRSNQIREGHLDRERALELTLEDNLPRMESIKEYLDMMDLDFDHVMNVVDSMPKRYGEGKKDV